MVLVDSRQNRLEFETVRQARALLIGGFGLTALGIVAAIANSPFTGPRVLMVAGLLLAGLTLVVRSRPRKARATLDLTEGSFVEPSGRHDLSGARGYRLSGSGLPSDPEPRQLYRVELELPGARMLVLLEHHDPARVVADLRKLHALFPLPVRLGWGLPQGATPWRGAGPRRTSAPPLAQTPRLRLSAAPYPAQRLSAVAIIIGVAGIAVLTGIWFAARFERGEPVAALSVVLHVITLTVLLVLALALLGDRCHFELGQRLTIDRRLFGIRRRRIELLTQSIRGVYAVSPHGTEAHHILIDSESGVFSAPCAGAPAHALARALAGVVPTSAANKDVSA